MVGSKFEASIGMSRKWEAREAGREVAETTLKNLSEHPKYFFLFSTIHYEKYGGFQELLNGVWEILPEGTPLIGGTVVGFMNDRGCFSHGCTAFASSYPHMDIATGIGHNTKKNPEKAAEDCVTTIKAGLRNSIYKHMFVFQHVSGPTVPHFPGVGSSFVVKGAIKSSFASKLIETSTKKLQKGIGREDEVLETMSNNLQESYIISGSASDDMKLSNNYQFIDKSVFTNSVVALAIKTDREFNVEYKHGFHKLYNQELKITDSTFQGKIIKKINNNDAVKEFLNAIKWSDTMLDERLHRKTFFFPLGFEYPDKTLSPSAIGAILGGAVSFSYEIPSDHLFVLTASGKSILDAIETCIDKNANVNFGISCCANFVTLGKSLYLLKDTMNEYLKNTLIVFTLGEGVYKPSEKLSKFFNETTMVLSIQ